MENTLYYTLSTIAQVEVALLAVLGVFIFYKQQKITDIQIGQGIASMEGHKEDVASWYNKKKLGINPTLIESISMRLQDAIHRKNVYGIEKELLIKTIEEVENNRSERFSYANHIYSLFSLTNRFKKRFSLMSMVIIFLCFLSITVSITTLSMIYVIQETPYVKSILLLNVLIFLVSIVSSMGLLVFAFYSKLPFEVHKYKRILELRKKLNNDLRRHKSLH
ncbi:hypothetical protein [Carboxylicivirga linearis]|uniref:DUF4239 domain-containing protein n=1 Tax=Carboxylicivirga linearis TaxID=1628157 RepID=A0ABS5JW67_9BACT|nr:hypothetical protein [Carboxylicivirga linearis]MBS2099145.1 hypothetical protein [Carboxylicivirga linearis]